MDLWIFGYGSLIWRPGFDFVELRDARLDGWARRFWQGSTDHRGVPGAPGRVVTLVRDAGATTWGRVYRVAPERRDEVLERLDVRESGGYERLTLELHTPGGPAPSVRAVTYNATPANPNYLGPASPRQIAHQVADSVGPSGPNVEYVLELRAALRDMGRSDDHVEAIATEIESRRV